MDESAPHPPQKQPSSIQQAYTCCVRVSAPACKCAYVCLCVGLSGAHTQIENMFGSPFGMFSLSFPHLMLLICMQQVCRWRHLDANTHTHTHGSIHGHIRTGHTQIHTCKEHTHAPKQAHAHSHSHGECPVLIRIWRNFENSHKYFGEYCILNSV